MYVTDILEAFTHYLTLGVVFPIFLAFGLYLTVRLRVVQISRLGDSLRCLFNKNRNDEGNISRFGAIAAVLAGNFGTGNISGMAVALTTGGPGALVWMWVMAFFGSAIQYTSCVLSVTYRRRTESGEYVGGPMYYLRDGLGYKTLGALFALFTLVGSITVGNFAQINSVILPLESLGLHPVMCSIVVAVLVGIVILGGIQRIASFATYIVPFKAILYLGTASLIIAMHYDRVLPSLMLMISCAFDTSSIVGGALGITIFKAMTTGFGRGLFATDAGTGIVPILQASARSNNPVMDGIATLVAPIMVMIVCTATGLVLLVTGAWQGSGLQSTNMVTYAFTTGLGSPMGGHIVLIALILFAYTTILAWAYCGEKAVNYLVGGDYGRWFRLGYILLIPVGAMMHVDIIWVLADLAIVGMLLLNLIGIIGLTKTSYELKFTEGHRNDENIIIAASKTHR